MLQLDPKTQSRLEQAKKFVVTTPRQTIKWVLHFLKTDCGQLSETDWIKIQAELTVFIRFYPEFKRGLGSLAINSRSFFTPTDYDHYPRMPNREEAKAFSKAALKLFQNFIRAKHIGPLWESFFFEELPVDISIKFPTAQKLESVFSIWVQDQTQLFKINLLLLLCEFAPHIKNCKPCGSLFLAKRKDQIFCSNKCATLTFQRKKRGTPPSRYGRRGRPPGTGKTTLI